MHNEDGGGRFQIIVCNPNRTQEKLNGMYVNRRTQLYSSGMYCYTRAQLHVSTIKFGHLQVVHEKLINRLYQRFLGFYGMWEGELLMYNLKMAKFDGRNM